MNAAYSIETVDAERVRITVAPASSPLKTIAGRLRLRSAAGQSSGSTFVVSAAGIETGEGTIISSDQIHRLVLRNCEAKVRPVTADTDPAELAATNQSLGRSARKAWKVWVEAGRRSTSLAVGLDCSTAFALLADVSRIVGMPIA